MKPLQAEIWAYRKGEAGRIVTKMKNEAEIRDSTTRDWIDAQECGRNLLRYDMAGGNRLTGNTEACLFYYYRTKHAERKEVKNCVSIEP